MSEPEQAGDESADRTERTGWLARARSWVARRKRVRLLIGAVAAAGALVVAVVLAVVILPKDDDGPSVEIAVDQPLVFHPVAEFLADLKPVGRGPVPFVRLTVVAQLPEADVVRLEARQAEIMAAVQNHLREQERDALVGRAGAERLRAEIMRIINDRIAPAEVRAVLFTEFLLD